jgi:hypothetical protein
MRSLKYIWPFEPFYTFCDYYKEGLKFKTCFGAFICELFFPLTDTLRRLHTILSYIPILWKDHDWDQGYLLDLLQFKLERIEKSLLKGHRRGDKVTLKDLHTMINLLKRIKEDPYHDIVFKDHEAKWGQLEWNSEKGRLGGRITRSKIKTGEDLDQECRESCILYHKVTELENQDLDMFFSLFRKRINHLWD